MTIIDNAALERATLPGLEHVTLAGSGAGLSHLSVWRQRLEPGAATPPHRHDCEEVVLIQSGRGTLHIADGIREFGPDSTLVLPADMTHQIVNSGTEPMDLIGILAMAPVEVRTPNGELIELPWAT